MNIDDNILKNKSKLKKELLNSNKSFIEKKIAILCGATANSLIDVLEVYLLNHGIKPTFYISEYNKYYEDAVFGSTELDEFKPDIIYIFTTFRNIIMDIDLDINNTKEDVDLILNNEFNKFKKIWDSLRKYNAVIIQNNFEYPNYRLLGNNDVVDFRGLSNFIMRLNNKIYEYATDEELNEGNKIYILDINYISSYFGLEKWHNNKYYALYKIPFDINAIPIVAKNLSNIIKSIYGKNKKVLALDLDNTLWGGVISEDGLSGINIGKETADGELYYGFQKYIKKLKSIGVILSVISKNDHDVAISGIKDSDGVLKEEDFVSIKANWEPKSENIYKLSKELNLGIDSFVFIDDNPMERDIVKSTHNDVEVPDIHTVEDYIKSIDNEGYFENTSITKEDLNKTENYKKNLMIYELQNSFSDYNEYLNTLEMEAIIKPFEEKYFERISQLSNKSNQFNLTTKRYSVEDIKKVASSDKYITLYGKLNDKFGENGIVSLIIGSIDNDILNIDLLLMSCRVLKRDMEYAMLDSLVHFAKARNIKTIKGEYIKTAKNAMVKDLYKDFGFTNINNSEASDNSFWELKDLFKYENKNKFIKVIH